MSLITFVCASPSASWTPTHNPDYGSGNVPMIQRHQPIDLTDGGAVYSYNHGESIPLSLNWAAMPTADLTTLLAFLTTICGSRNTFVFTDPDAAAHSATRIANARALAYREVEVGRHEVSLELEVA
jgi:hypothetical protein